MNPNPPVLIAGAGPTGLVLALWLTKKGVPVRIIDQAATTGTTSRAIVMHARNLELYRQMGIDKIAVDRGMPFIAVSLWVKGKRKARAPFGDGGKGISPFHYALILTQDKQEEMLNEELAKLGVTVEQSTTLLSYETKDGDVAATLQKPNGEKETVYAQYLCGCDGAHSVVRHQMKVEFAGGTYEDIFYVADLHIGGILADGEMHGALDDADFLAIFPMKGEGNIRLVGAVRSDEIGKEHFEWKDVHQDIIRRLNMEVKEVRWFSTYRVHHRVASHFREKHVFLLGDAGHIHSPVGGQGMNTGIGDAVNLAWKLAEVIKNKAPEKLLDTYEPERIAFARQLVHTTDKAFVFVNKRSRLATWVRTVLVPLLFNFLSHFMAFRRMMFRILSQTRIAYPQSALSRGSAGKIKAGDRLPYVEELDNYRDLKMSWQLHVYGTISEAVKTVCTVHNIPVAVFEWKDAAGKKGFKKGALYLLRPDGYVGLITEDAVVLEAYVKEWIR